LVFFGGMAAGSAFWGAVATHTGMKLALQCAAAGLILGLVSTLFYPLTSGETLNLDPSLHWSDPTVVHEPRPDDGPVLVMVEYRIDPNRADEFVQAMQEIKRIVRRDGASRWGLFHDLATPGRYIQTFLVESWAEHIRQHARVTKSDQAIEERVNSFHVGNGPPIVHHLVAEDVEKGKQRNLHRI
jgi:hypothetical protein